MYKVILILDKCFLKNEGGVKLTPSPEKLPSKSLIRVKVVIEKKNDRACSKKYASKKLIVNHNENGNDYDKLIKLIRHKQTQT